MTYLTQKQFPRRAFLRPPRFHGAAHLAKLTGKPIVPASDMLAATWDQQGFVVYSSALRSVAVKLSKIASDLILLTSGPRAGLFEINLPALQDETVLAALILAVVLPTAVLLIRGVRSGRWSDGRCRSR